MDPEPLHFVTNTDSSQHYRAIRFELKRIHSVDQQHAKGQWVLPSGAAETKHSEPNKALEKRANVWNVAVAAHQTVSLTAAGHGFLVDARSDNDLQVLCKASGTWEELPHLQLAREAELRSVAEKLSSAAPPGKAAVGPLMPGKAVPDTKVPDEARPRVFDIAVKDDCEWELVVKNVSERPQTLYVLQELP